MRGSRASQRARIGLAHILRCHADVYLCGHQHLAAHMKLRPSRKRVAAECSCDFAIVGNSSKVCKIVFARVYVCVSESCLAFC